MNETASPSMPEAPPAFVKQNAPGAVASMVLGILALVIPCLGLLFAIPAVILGHRSQSRIGKAGGMLTGGGQALAGLIMGYLGIGLSIFVGPLMLAITLPAFNVARSRAQTVVCQNNLKMMQVAKVAVAVSGEGEYTEATVIAHLPEARMPVCPAKGEYTIGNSEEEPYCSVHGSISEPEGPAASLHRR